MRARLHRRFRAGLAALAFAAVVLAGALHAPRPAPAEVPPAGYQVPGDNVLERVRGSRVFFVYRLVGPAGRGARCAESGPDQPGCISGFRVLETHATAPNIWRNGLKRLIGQQATFDGSAQRCEFVPDVGVRFTRATSTTNVVLDYHCLQIMVWSNGELVGYGSFEREWLTFFRFAIHTFPDDLRLRQLYEAHRRRLAPTPVQRRATPRR